MKKLTVLTAALLFYGAIFAQQQSSANPPIGLEVLPGTAGYGAQMVFNKSFRSIPKFGLFSVTNMFSKWGEPTSRSMMNQIHLTYQFLKGFKALAGTHYTPVTGMRPNAAIMYAHATKEVFVTVVPRIDLSRNSNWEWMGLVEYKPALNEDWQIYTRVQALYSKNIATGNHARSYLMLRAGLMYDDFRFGLGANWDAYGAGATKSTVQNYGLFLAANVFN